MIPSPYKHNAQCVSDNCRQHFAKQLPSLAATWHEMTWSAFIWWLPTHDPLFVSWQRQRQRAVKSLSMILRRSWMKLFLNFLEHSIRFWSLEVDDFESVSIDCHLRKPLQKSRCAFFERVLRQTKGTSSAPNSFIHSNWEQMMLALNNNHIAFQPVSI